MSGNFKCSVEGEEFNSMEELWMHRGRLAGDGKHDPLGMPVKIPATSSATMPPLVAKKVAIACPECGKEFATESSLNGHRTWHARYHCERCGAEMGKSSFVRHMARHNQGIRHEPRGDYFCEVCGFQSKTPTTVLGHITTAHPEKEEIAAIPKSPEKRTWKPLQSSHTPIESQEYFGPDAIEMDEYRTDLPGLHGQFCETCSILVLTDRRVSHCAGCGLPLKAVYMWIALDRGDSKQGIIDRLQMPELTKKGDDKDGKVICH